MIRNCSTKSVPKGARVWLVAGETIAGRKHYFLYYRFIVDRLGAKEASGRVFRRFNPRVEVGNEPWFPGFLHFMGNFGRGLSPIRPDDIRNFEDAVGRSAPGDRPTSRPSSAPAPRGAGFANAERAAEVEQTAVRTVTERYRAAGWTVTSVESDNLGYDLLCKKGNEEWHLEVKGVSGAIPSVLPTGNERNTARLDNRWKLAVVTDALQESTIREYRGKDLDAHFDIAPITYRLLPRAG